MRDGGGSLVSIRDLDRQDLLALLDAAEGFLAVDAPVAHRARLAGAAVGLVFCEPSTRTRVSFELAARRLGADVVALDEHHSSRSKGETLIDTLATLRAMGVRQFVLRHAEDGIMARLRDSLPPGSGLVNAGEGTRSHPTQGLLDALTIRRHRPDLTQLTVTIVGDVAHSRVARSTVAALELLGVGAVRLVGPEGFLPPPGQMRGERLHDLERALSGADVVVALRIQRERMAATEFPEARSYRERYGLDVARLERLARPDCLLLHPGPVNWGIELDPDLARWPRNLMREQVRNGVAVRMAVLATLAEALHADA